MPDPFRPKFGGRKVALSNFRPHLITHFNGWLLTDVIKNSSNFAEIPKLETGCWAVWSPLCWWIYFHGRIIGLSISQFNIARRVTINILCASSRKMTRARPIISWLWLLHICLTSGKCEEALLPVWSSVSPIGHLLWAMHFKNACVRAWLRRGYNLSWMRHLNVIWKEWLAGKPKGTATTRECLRF